ncbi:MAG TPA: polysaccharide biosynthesis tyrosine autokinase, partial [Polyangiaceae bacterium]|nr:polysaccharide biosynthesis tyrosine autokinase [Polyangiaceae bacterium]
YQAEATLKFDPNPPTPLGQDVEGVVDIGVGTYWNRQEYYQTQYQIIESQRVARETVARLALHHDQGFLANLPAGAEPAHPRKVDEDGAALILRARLEVKPIKDSQLAIVRVTDANPERAARIVNTLTDVYVELNISDAYESTDRAIADLSEQQEKLERDLRASEEKLHDFKEEHDILSVALDDKSSMLLSEMQAYNDALAKVRAEIQEAAARHSQLSKVSADVSKLPASELLKSPVLQSLRLEYIATIRERDAILATGKGPEHPLAKAAIARSEAAKAELLEEVNNIKGATAAELRVLQSRAGGLAALLEKTKKRALELNKLEIEYRRRDREQHNLEKLYELVLSRTKESGLTRVMMLNNISVVDRARIPNAPILPRVPVNIGVGLLLGLLLGAAAAIGRGTLDRTVKTPDDVEREFGVTTLGLLPTIGKAGSGPSYYVKRRRGRKEPETFSKPELVVHERPRSSVAEAARAIRTNLTFMSPDDPFKTLLLTSAGPAEGKTTVACCVAVALAQAGQRVVIVDCDLRRARVHRVFGFSSDVGVTTAALDGDIERAARETEVPNLHAIAAGPLPPNPAELLQSTKFRTLLAELEKKFDRVVIDSPPLVAVTDAAVLSTMADATLMVVRAHVTRKDVARHALSALRKVGTPVTGCIINAVDFDRHEYRGSYYYYHRDYYGDDDAGARA